MRHRAAMGMVLLVATALRAEVPSPHASVRRFDLDGLVLYAKEVPGDWAFACVAVSAGRLQDGGRAGLAHLVEHVSFTDESGSQAARQAAVMALGGDSGATTWDRTTRYWIRVPAAHAGEAVRLVADHVRPRTFTSAQVDAERRVVAIEDGLSPTPGSGLRRALRKASSLVAAPAPRRVSGGAEVDDGVGRPTWRTLEAIRVDDVQGFHDTHHVRERLVVGVFGPIAPEAARDLVATAFAEVPQGTPAPPRLAPRPPSRRVTTWSEHGTASVDLTYAFNVPDRRSRETLLAVRNLVGLELNRRLRFTEGSAYGFHVSVRVAGRTGTLNLNSRVDPAGAAAVAEEARRIMGEAARGDATWIPELREPVALAFASGASTAGQLMDWVSTDAWQRDTYDAFPDPVSRVRSLSAKDVGRWFEESALAGEPNLVVTIPDPLPATLPRAVTTLATAVLGVLLLRRAARRSRSPMGAVSQPLRWGWITGCILLAGAVVGAWSVARVAQHAALWMAGSTESRAAWLVVQVIVDAAMPLLLLLAASLLPWRVACDSEGLRLEALAWPIRRLKWSEIADVRPGGLLDAVQAPPWKWRLLSLSGRPGVVVSTTSGSRWWLRVDDPEALLQARDAPDRVAMGA